MDPQKLNQEVKVSWRYSSKTQKNFPVNLTQKTVPARCGHSNENLWRPGTTADAARDSYVDSRY
jgi:hypothetical protein